MEKIKIMPLGDSMTNGFSVDGAYRNRLCDLLEEYGLSNYIKFVGTQNTGTGYDNTNEGHSGWAIAKVPQEKDIEGNGRDGITEMIDRWVGDTKPDIILLQIGTNDVISLYEMENAPKRMEILLNKIFDNIADDGKVYIAKIPYFAESSKYNNTGKLQAEINLLIDNYNYALTNIARKRGITVVDVNACITLDDLQDGVHPTADGYAKIGGLWFETIKDELINRIKNKEMVK